MTYPKIIMIVNDGNILEYQEAKPVNKVLMLFYKYTLSEEKLNIILPIPVSQLEKMIKERIAVDVSNS